MVGEVAAFHLVPRLTRELVLLRLFLAQRRREGEELLEFPWVGHALRHLSFRDRDAPLHLLALSFQI